MNRKILLILMGAMMLLTKASAQTTEQEDAVGSPVISSSVICAKKHAYCPFVHMSVCPYKSFL